MLDKPLLILLFWQFGGLQCIRAALSSGRSHSAAFALLAGCTALPPSGELLVGLLGSDNDSRCFLEQLWKSSSLLPGACPS